MLLVKEIKNFFLPFYKSKKTKKILQILNSDGNNQAMFVGGCVRNFLRKEKITDIDIATTLTPNDIIKKFENSEIKVKKTGIEHGTLTLLYDDQKYEITTLRKDVSTDGRHANVEYTENWKQDSERRDFTINAIYLDQKGKFFDPQDGLKDLKNNKVRFIGNPNSRIKEDYLRILRFLRFSIQYKNFDISQETQKAIRINLNGIKNLSKERVFSELKKIVELKNFYDLSKNEFLFNIFKLIFPEFLYLNRLKKLEKISKKISFIPNSEIIFTVMLLDSSNNHKYFFHKYNLPNNIKKNLDIYSEVIKLSQKNANFFLQELNKNIFIYGKPEIKKIFLINSVLSKKNLSAKTEEVFNKIDKILIPKFPISGNDLIKRGVKSGKNIGEILKKIEQIWLKNNFKIENHQINALVKKYLT